MHRTVHVQMYLYIQYREYVHEPCCPGNSEVHMIYIQYMYMQCTDMSVYLSRNEVFPRDSVLLPVEHCVLLSHVSVRLQPHLSGRRLDGREALVHCRRGEAQGRYCAIPCTRMCVTCFHDAKTLSIAGNRLILIADL